jgi:PAS domain S-box-containing protein
MLTSFLKWRRSSFVGLVVLPLFVVASALVVLERQLTEYRLREAVKLESLRDIEQRLLDLATVVEGCDSQADAEHHIASIAFKKDIGAVALADVESHTIFASSNPADHDRNLSVASDRAAARSLQDFARTRQISFNFNDGDTEGVFPVRLPWKKAADRGLAAEGAIYLRLDDHRRLASGLQPLAHWFDGLAAGRLLLVWGLGIWLVRRHLIRPAREIKGALRAIAGGQTATRMPDLGGAELGQVAKVLNETLDQLQQADQQVRAMATVAPVGIFWTNPQGECLKVNPAWSQLTGLSEAEALGTGWMQAIYPPDREHLKLVWSNPDSSGILGTKTYRLVHRDGTIRWVLRSILPLQDDHGQLTGYIGSLTDITAVREAEQALRESEALYANLVEASRDLIFQCDAGGRFIFLNSAWERSLGYSAPEMLGHLPTDFCAPSATAPDPGLFTGDLSGGRAATGELVLRSKSGNRVELLVEITPLGGDDEAVRGVRGTAYDVTEQRKSERALKATDQLFTSFFVNTTEAMVIGALGGKTIMEANEAANRLFGYAGRELIDRDHRCLLDETDPRVGPAMKVREATGSFVGEVRCVRKTGEKFEAEITSILYTGRQGHLISGTIFRDLSAKKELHAVQLRAQRLESIGTLTGGIAHDFNNALGPLLLGFDLLKKQFPERAGLVDKMRASTARAADTVRQLMTFARGSDGPHLPVASEAMFDETARIVTSTFPRDIRCITSVAPDTWPLLGNETQLQQVLLNLCLNARDAMPDGGELRLEAKNIVLLDRVETGRGHGDPGNYVRWKVSDSGSGMTAAVLDRIFDPFFTTKGPGAGTGLGLAMVLGIVRGHHGFLDVQSTPDAGTTFLLYFPAGALAAQEQAVASPPAPGARLGQQATILLVDDEPIVRTITASVLTSLGYKVVTATDGNDALFKLAELEGEVKAMLTDLQMPHMNGQVLVRVVLKMMPDLPIIVMSGTFTAEAEADLSGLGVRGRLEKPFDESKLEAVLREVFPEGMPPPQPADQPAQI